MRSAGAAAVLTSVGAVLTFVATAAVVSAQSQAPGVIRPAPAAPQPAGATGATIRGRILTDNGAPIRAARVTISPTPADPPRNQYSLTDDEGWYEAKGLAAGRYNIMAAKDGFISLSYGETKPSQGGKPLSVNATEVADRIDLVLPRGGVIAGRVMDIYGEPVANASVRPHLVSFRDGSRRLAIQNVANTNALGEYRLFALTPGSYYVSAIKTAMTTPPTGGTINEDYAYPRTFAPATLDESIATLVTLEGAQTISGIDVTVAPLRRATITGTLIDAEGKPAGGLVEMYQAGKSEPQNLFVRPATLANGGAFELSGVLPGSYELRVRFQNGNTGAAVGAVTVAGENISGIRLRPISNAIVRGRVVIDASLQAPPVNQIRIAARDTDPFASLNWRPAEAAVQPDMTFVMAALPGQWTMAPVVPRGWMLKAVRYRGTDVTDSGIAFREGEEVRDIEIELTNRLTTVAGVVADTRGEIVDDCTVIVFAKDQLRWNSTDRYYARVRPAGTERRFTVPALAPGDYYAVAVPFLDINRAHDPELLERLSRLATSLTLQEGETRTLDLKLVTP